MGRPKGSPNRAEQARRFITRFEAMLLKKDPEKYNGGMEGIFARIVYDAGRTGEYKTVAYVLRTLIQYKLGMPPQPVEVSGHLDMTAVIQAARERVLSRGKKES